MPIMREKGRFILGLVGAVVTAAASAAVSTMVIARLSKPKASGTPADAPPPLVPIKLTTHSADVDLGGGWTMHDVSEYQSAIGRTKLGLGYSPGAVVTLVLSNRGAMPVPYLATIANRLPEGYAGSWTALRPPGGPQMVDFGPEHILV